MSEDDANRDPTGSDAALDRILARGEQLVRELGPILPLVLTFCFEGHDFKARFEASEDGDGALLLLEADLGRVPFTVEDPAGRARLLDRIASGGDGRPGRFLVHKGRLKLLSRTRLPLPADGLALISALAICLLEARPFLADFAAGQGDAGQGSAGQGDAGQRPAGGRRFSAERRAAGSGAA